MSKEVGGMVGSRRVQGAESAQRATQPSGRLLAGEVVIRPDDARAAP